MQLNKTYANEAHGLAQVVRTGWFREVAIKSMDAQALRMLLMARAQLVSQRQAVANNIRSLLKTFGFGITHGSKGPFAARVREVIADNATLAVIIEPLLLAWQAIREQVGALDRQVNLRAKTDAAARRPMTVPGVGVICGCQQTAERTMSWQDRSPQPDQAWHRARGHQGPVLAVLAAKGRLRVAPRFP